MDKLAVQIDDSTVIFGPVIEKVYESEGVTYLEDDQGRLYVDYKKLLELFDEQATVHNPRCNEDIPESKQRSAGKHTRIAKYYRDKYKRKT